MKQQSIMLNANCQLIQCTHITDLLSNLRRLLDSMNIKVFIAMRNVSCSQMVQNTSPSLYTNEKCKSNFNNNSSKVYLMFSSESVINKIVYTSDSALTICGPEFQRTSLIAYSYFCLLYKCFSFMRRTLLCCHHCFKFSGNDWLWNRDGGVGRCCCTLATVKLCRFKYWYTGIIYVSLILPNVVSFFYKYEGKRRFVIAFKIVIGLCYFSPLPWTQLKWVLSLCFPDNFRPQIVHL